MKVARWLQLFKEHREKRIFSFADLQQMSGIRKEVLYVEMSRLVKSGVVTRLAQGWYANPFNPPLVEEVAMALRHPSYLSLEYALSAHNVLSQAAMALTLVTTKPPHLFKMPSAVFEYHQISRKYFFGHYFHGHAHIAYPEKALLDWLYIRHVRNRELDRDGVASLLDDMYLEELDRERLRSFMDRFDPATARLTGELLGL